MNWRDKLKKNFVFKSFNIFICFVFVVVSLPPGSAQTVYPKPEVPVPTDSVSSLIFEDIQISEDIGKIREVYVSENNPEGKTIILLQDAHCNYKAHKSIKNILDTLIKKHGIDFVGVEGARGLIDFSAYHVGTKKQREAFCEEYMKKGLITGVECFGVTEDSTPFRLYGLENKDVYLDNFFALKDAFEERGKSLRYLDILESVINEIKPGIYSDKLKELDKQHSDFLGKKIKQGDYIIYLSNLLKKLHENNLINIEEYWGTYKNFTLLEENVRLERKIDFSLQEEEQKKFWEKAEKELNKNSFKELKDLNDGFENKKVSKFNYYSYLFDKITELKLEKECENLYKFALLRKKFQKVKSDKVREEIRDLAYNLKLSLSENEAQRKLVKASRHVYILKRLVDLRVTRDQLAFYKNREDSFELPLMVSWLKIKSEELNIKWPGKLDNEKFPVSYAILSADDYYRGLLLRDRIMLFNLLNSMALRGVNESILISGGFHTEGIAKLLKRHGYSYVVITPKVGKPTDQYFNVMMDLNISQPSLGNVSLSGLAPPLMLQNGLDIKSYLGLKTILSSILQTNDPAVLDKKIKQQRHFKENLSQIEKKDLKALIDKYKQVFKQNTKKFKKGLQVLEQLEIKAGIRKEKTKWQKFWKLEASLADITNEETLSVEERNRLKIRRINYINSRLRTANDKELEEIKDLWGIKDEKVNVSLIQLFHSRDGILNKDKKLFRDLVDVHKEHLKTVLTNIQTNDIFKSSLKDSTEMDLTSVQIKLFREMVTLCGYENFLDQLENVSKLEIQKFYKKIVKKINNNEEIGNDIQKFIQDNVKDVTVQAPSKNRIELSDFQGNELVNTLMMMNALNVEMRKHLNQKKSIDLNKIGELFFPKSKPVQLRDDRGNLRGETVSLNRAFEYREMLKKHNYYKYMLTEEYQTTLDNEKEHRKTILKEVFKKYKTPEEDDSKAPLTYKDISDLIKKDDEDGKIKKAVQEYLKEELTLIKNQLKGDSREDVESKLMEGELRTRAISLINASLSISKGWVSLSDMQIIGALGSFEGGKVLELATGEGKTAVSIAAAFLNSLGVNKKLEKENADALRKVKKQITETSNEDELKVLEAHKEFLEKKSNGFGSLIVTTKDNSAEDTYEDAKKAFDLLGVSVGVYLSPEGKDESLKQKVNEANQVAYDMDVTILSTSQFHFSVLQDKFVVDSEKNKTIKRDLKDYAMIVDEFDSVMIHQAKTEYIMSGSSNLSDKKFSKENIQIEEGENREEKFNEYMENVKGLIDGLDESMEKEKKYLNVLLENLKNGKYSISQLKYIFAYIACLKTNAFKDLEAEYNNSESVVKKSFRNRDKVFGTQSGLSKYILNELFSSEEEWKSYLKGQLDAKVNNTKGVDYDVTKNGIVKLIDGKTGTYQNSVRQQPNVTGGGGHIALELLNNVQIKSDSLTRASLSARDVFREVGKKAGMTGTAVQSNQSQARLYEVEYMPVPTNTPIIRKDIGLSGNVLEGKKKYPIFRKDSQRLAYLINSITKDVKRGQPVLIFADSDINAAALSNKINKEFKKRFNEDGKTTELFETFRKMGRAKLNEKGEGVLILNKYTASTGEDKEKEDEIVNKKAGEPGAITVVTNIGGRGTDFKLIGASKESGFHNYGFGYVDGDDLEKQRRGRAGRGGALGYTEELISLESDFENIKRSAIDLDDKDRVIIETLKKEEQDLDKELPVEVIWKAIKKSQERDVIELGKQIEDDVLMGELKYSEQEIFNDLRRNFYQILMENNIRNSPKTRKLPGKIKTIIEQIEKSNVGEEKLFEEYSNKFGIEINDAFKKFLIDESKKDKDSRKYIIDRLNYYLVMQLTELHWQNVISTTLGDWFKDVRKEQLDVSYKVTVKDKNTGEEKEVISDEVKNRLSLKDRLKEAFDTKIIIFNEDFTIFINNHLTRQDDILKEKARKKDEQPSPEVDVISLETEIDELTDISFTRARSSEAKEVVESHEQMLKKAASSQDYVNIFKKTYSTCDGRLNFFTPDEAEAIQKSVSESEIKTETNEEGIANKKKISDLLSSKWKTKNQKITALRKLLENIDIKKLKKAYEDENEDLIKQLDDFLPYAFGGKESKIRTRIFELTEVENSRLVSIENKHKAKLLNEILKQKSIGKKEYSRIKEILLSSKTKDLSESYSALFNKSLKDEIKAKFEDDTGSISKFRKGYLEQIFSERGLTEKIILMEKIGFGGISDTNQNITEYASKINPEVILNLSDFLKKNRIMDKRLYNVLMTNAYSNLYTKSIKEAKNTSLTANKIFHNKLKQYSSYKSIQFEDDNLAKTQIEENVKTLQEDIKKWKKNAGEEDKQKLEDLENRINELKDLRTPEAYSQLDNIFSEIREIESIMRLQYYLGKNFQGETIQEKITDAFLYSILRRHRKGRFKQILYWKGILKTVFLRNNFRRSIDAIINEDNAHLFEKVLKNENSVTSGRFSAYWASDLKEWLRYKSQSYTAKEEDQRIFNQMMAFTRRNKKGKVGSWFIKAIKTIGVKSAALRDLSDKLYYSDENEATIADFFNKLENPVETIFKFAKSEGKVSAEDEADWTFDINKNQIFKKVFDDISIKFDEAGINPEALKVLLNCPNGGMPLVKIISYLKRSLKPYRAGMLLFDINTRHLIDMINNLSPEGIAYLRLNPVYLSFMEALCKSDYENLNESWLIIKDLLGIDRDKTIKEYCAEKGMEEDGFTKISKESYFNILKEANDISNYLSSSRVFAAKVKIERRRGFLKKIGISNEWMDRKALGVFKYEANDVLKVVKRAQDQARIYATERGQINQEKYKKYMLDFAKNCVGDMELEGEDLVNRVKKEYEAGIADFILGNEKLDFEVLIKRAKGAWKNRSNKDLGKFALENATADELLDLEAISDLSSEIKYKYSRLSELKGQENKEEEIANLNDEIIRLKQQLINEITELKGSVKTGLIDAYNYNTRTSLFESGYNRLAQIVEMLNEDQNYSKILKDAGIDGKMLVSLIESKGVLNKEKLFVSKLENLYPNIRNERAINKSNLLRAIAELSDKMCKVEVNDEEVKEADSNVTYFKDKQKDAQIRYMQALEKTNRILQTVIKVIFSVIQIVVAAINFALIVGATTVGMGWVAFGISVASMAVLGILQGVLSLTCDAIFNYYKSDIKSKLWGGVGAFFKLALKITLNVGFGIANAFAGAFSTLLAVPKALIGLIGNLIINEIIKAIMPEATTDYSNNIMDMASGGYNAINPDVFNELVDKLAKGSNRAIKILTQSASGAFRIISNLFGLAETTDQTRVVGAAFETVVNEDFSRLRDVLQEINEQDDEGEDSSEIIRRKKREARVNEVLEERAEKRLSKAKSDIAFLKDSVQAQIKEREESIQQSAEELSVLEENERTAQKRKAREIILENEKKHALREKIKRERAELIKRKRAEALRKRNEQLKKSRTDANITTTQGTGAIGAGEDAVIERIDAKTIVFKDGSGAEINRSKTHELNDVITEVNKKERLQAVKANLTQKLNDLLTDASANKELSKQLKGMKINKKKINKAIANIEERLFLFEKTKNNQGKYILGAGVIYQKENQIGLDSEFFNALLNYNNGELLEIALFHEALESITDVGTHSKIRGVQDIIYGTENKTLTHFIRSFNIARSAYDGDDDETERNQFQQKVFEFLKEGKKDKENYNDIALKLLNNEVKVETLELIIEALERSNEKELPDFDYSDELVLMVLKKLNEKESTDSSFTSFLKKRAKISLKKLGLLEYEIKDIEKGMELLFKNAEISEEDLQLNQQQEIFLGLLGKRLFSVNSQDKRLQAKKMSSLIAVSILERTGNIDLLDKVTRTLNYALTNDDARYDDLSDENINNDIKSLLKRLESQSKVIEQLNAFKDSLDNELVISDKIALVKDQRDKSIIKIKFKKKIYRDAEFKKLKGYSIKEYFALRGALNEDVNVEEWVELRNGLSSGLTQSFKKSDRQTLFDISDMTDENEIRQVLSFFKKVVKNKKAINNHKIYGEFSDLFLEVAKNMGISEAELKKVQITDSSKIKQALSKKRVIISHNINNFKNVNHITGSVILNSKNSMEATMLNVLSFVCNKPQIIDTLISRVDSEEGKEELNGFKKFIEDDSKFDQLGNFFNQFVIPKIKPILETILSELADEEETVLISG